MVYIEKLVLLIDCIYNSWTYQLQRGVVYYNTRLNLPPKARKKGLPSTLVPKFSIYTLWTLCSRIAWQNMLNCSWYLCGNLNTLKLFVIQLWNTTKISLSNRSTHATAYGRSFGNCWISVCGNRVTILRISRPPAGCGGGAGCSCCWATLCVVGVKSPSGNCTQE